MQHIPYRGGAPAALAVATGEVQLVLLSPLGMWPQPQAGTARRRWRPAGSSAIRNCPICRPHRGRLSRLRGGAMAGPPRPSQDADGHVATINSEVNKAKLAQQGTTAAGTTPEEFRTLITTEIKTWKETAERAGLEPQ
jgi:tripartite-type tricarboxylate transporter receptor subunit TctC